MADLLRSVTDSMAVAEAAVDILTAILEVRWMLVKNDGSEQQIRMAVRMCHGVEESFRS